MADQLLRDALRVFLKNWRDDLSPAWQQVMGDVSPAFDDVQDDLLLRSSSADEKIYPGRKSHPLPGAPAGAEVFRALARVAPADVKAVVIGQDPYTRIAQATGRAFEQGDLLSWTTPGVKLAPSLKRLLQVTAFQRTGAATYLAAGGWPKVAERLSAGTLAIEPPRALFDHWEAQGVIFLNAGLTISRYVQGGGPEQKFGHIPLWRPIIHQILQALVNRPQGSVVFLTWGTFAKNVLKSAQVDRLPGWSRAAAAATDHPAVPGFLRSPTPFLAANDALVRLGGQPIDW
jgi:uracil-DNA glycosylase